MHKRAIIARPKTITFSEECYQMRAKIIDGPPTLLDRIVTIQLTTAQLEFILKWNSIDDKRPMLVLEQ